MKSNLNTIVKNIRPLDQKFIEKAKEYHKTLLMPEGALDSLLGIVEKLAGIYGEFPVRTISKKQVVLFAADHGVATEGVSAYPQEVTQQMLGSFANNWAVITVLSKNKMPVTVIDVGVKGKPLIDPKIINKKIAEGTNNFKEKSAMTKEEVLKALEVGIETAKGLSEKNTELAVVGEMGIGNTTSTSAITAVMLKEKVEDVTGRGTGITDLGLQNKISVIKKAFKLHKPNHNDPIDVLSKVGGFEIAAMTGFILGCARLRIPVVLDGFITGAAALLAQKISPTSINYCIAGHCSKEIGHKKILTHLELVPILNLDLRLGEGSGAALSLPIIEQAILISRETATFETAQVSNKS